MQVTNSETRLGMQKGIVAGGSIRYGGAVEQEIRKSRQSTRRRVRFPVLTSNPAVMGGDVLNPRDAWRTYRTMPAKQRIGFAPEPFGLEGWKKLTALNRSMSKMWTDALAAFAQSASMRLVTLDRALARVVPRSLCLIR
jgi:predicted nucleic acid-binding protein